MKEQKIYNLKIINQIDCTKKKKCFFNWLKKYNKHNNNTKGKNSLNNYNNLCVSNVI